MLNFSLIKKPQNLNDLRLIKEFSDGEHGYKNRKSRARILVIDDKEVPQAQILRDRGYNLKFVSDIEDLDMLAGYDILLCDIKGVGSRFQSPLEGAYVAAHAKQDYPSMRVVLITGSKYEDRFNDILRKCDGYLNKDASVDDWEELITEKIGEVSDPVIQWKILRARLLDSDVNLLTVYHLEQQYITAMKNRNPDSFPSKKTTELLDPIARKMIIGLVKSALFRMISGGATG